MKIAWGSLNGRIAVMIAIVSIVALVTTLFIGGIYLSQGHHQTLLGILIGVVVVSSGYILLHGIYDLWTERRSVGVRTHLETED